MLYYFVVSQIPLFMPIFLDIGFMWDVVAAAERLRAHVSTDLVIGCGLEVDLTPASPAGLQVTHCLLKNLYDP